MPSRSTVAAVAALIPLFLAASLLPNTAAGSVVAKVQSPDRGWSPAEMRAADSAGDRLATQPPGALPPRATQSAAGGARELTIERERPFSSHGRIFFQKVGEPDALYACSGTVVKSRKQNLVFTAGHCVFDLEKEEFNERITFVPAYRDGEAPFGQFPAKVRYTTTGWIGGDGTGHDIGAITVGEPIERTVGGRPINFLYSPTNGSRVSIFGYPAKPSPTYDGEKPITCDSAIVTGINTGNPPSLAASPCDMQQGSSGGGWINPAGQLFSVVSHGYCDNEPKACGYIFGPRLGNPGIQIYRRAGGSVRPTLKITRGPKGRQFHRLARFTFRTKASTPVVLECRMSGPSFRKARARFKRCGRRRVYRNLQPGRYVLRVRAIDQTGRRAQQRRQFRVVNRQR